MEVSVILDYIKMSDTTVLRRGIWCDEWQKVTGGSKAGFEKYLKGVSEDEKDVRTNSRWHLI